MKIRLLMLAVAVIFMVSALSATVINAGPLETWNLRTSCTSEVLRGVAFGNSVFVAVGGNGTDGGIICVSEDGTTWTEAADSPFENAYLNAVAFGNGIFVAVGDGGTILTSTDGDEWTQRTSGTNYSLSGVTFGSGRFVAVGYGQGAMILTSTNGTTWSNVYPESCSWFDPCEWLYTVGSGNNKFFAAGWSSNNTYILTSTGGTSWSKKWLSGRWYLEGTAFGNNKYIAAGGYCGDVGPCYGVLFTSPNGDTWTYFNLSDEPGVIPSPYPPFKGATFKGSQVNSFVIVGKNGTILTSPTGTDWSPQISPTTEHLNDVAYGRRTFVAVGESGTILQSGVFPAKLTVVKTGSGTGTVASSPAGIDCGSDCSEVYDATQFDINLTATAGLNSVFNSWSGCTTPSGTNCYVNLVDDMTVTARFDALAACSVSITPRRARFDNTGGTGAINLSTASYCSWTATSSAAWLQITSGASGTGNGTINYSVEANGTGSSRNATITVQSGSSSRTFRVRQNR